MSDRTRKFLKYLRIAWTAFFAVVTVLLIVLWVRSYRFTDQVAIPVGSTRMCICESVYGRFVITRPQHSVIPPLHLSTAPGVVGTVYLTKGISVHKGNLWVSQPFLAGLSAAIAIAPWLQSRFSLRTLLIATTLVAVVLGTAVYFARS